VDGSRAVSTPADGRGLTSVLFERFNAGMAAEYYVERPPLPELAGVVRTVWVQRTGPEPYTQRHLPTGGVEIHFPLGGPPPRLLGPLTGAVVEVLPPSTTLVGVRFLPGAAPPPLPAFLDELLDDRVPLAEVWGREVDRLGEAMTGAADPEKALRLLQERLLHRFRRAGGVDPLLAEMVRRLMPWRPIEVGALAAHLTLSASQLRRRCLRTVGVGPKTLQRTLRFQGFLAPGRGGAAWLAAETGYADQAHLSRECLRLTGLSPSELLGGDVDRCACGHDHTASYGPFLAGYAKAPPRA
jgi:AraC-like DNA-binding protein